MRLILWLFSLAFILPLYSCSGDKKESGTIERPNMKNTYDGKYDYVGNYYENKVYVDSKRIRYETKSMFLVPVFTSKEDIVILYKGKGDNEYAWIDTPNEKIEYRIVDKESIEHLMWSVATNSSTSEKRKTGNNSKKWLYVADIMSDDFSEVVYTYVLSGLFHDKSLNKDYVVGLTRVEEQWIFRYDLEKDSIWAYQADMMWAPSLIHSNQIKNQKIKKDGVESGILSLLRNKRLIQHEPVR